MKLSDLTAYAKRKYNIDEDHKWADFKDFSVLADPETKKWAALLMRRKDDATGDTLELCDIKYPSDNIASIAYLSPPYRMHGKSWTGVKFDESTNPETVFKLFDKAIEQIESEANNKSSGGYKIVLDNTRGNEKNAYHDTPIPRLSFRSKSAPAQTPETNDVSPPKIIELRKMIKAAAHTPAGGYATYVSERAKNFYEQAKFMEDYEDDAKWEGSFFNYYPTYELLNNRQLRGYFGWRTRVRKGEFPPISPSAAYIYIYELLNGIGADSPEDVLNKLDEFEKGFIKGDEDVAYMRMNLKRWKFEFCVVNNLPIEITLKYADQNKINKDRALHILKRPKEFSDKEVFDALMAYAEKSREETPAIGANEEAAYRVFADSWRNALSYRQDNKSLFTLCFGKKIRRHAYPLYNAVYYNKPGEERFSYEIDENRKYEYERRAWFVSSYDRIYFDRSLFRGFLHETDLKLRRYLKTGRYLKEKPEEAWADPYIEAAIDKFERERIEAARPKITIEASNLEKIRRDAADTRESLLTEEERGIDNSYNADNKDNGSRAAAGDTIKLFDYDDMIDQYRDIPEFVLNKTHAAILKDLLNGGTADDILKQAHLMPTIAADEINDAFFDEVGDNIVDTENDKLFIIDDYKPDIERLIGG